MPKPRLTAVVNVRLEISAEQMGAIRARIGRRTPVVKFAKAAIALGCRVAEDDLRTLPVVYRGSGPVESVFLELPPTLVARMRAVTDRHGIERTAFVRSCFAHALETGH